VVTEARDRSGEDARAVGRLAFFSDAIFAIALVINVKHLPVPPSYVTSDVLHDNLGDMVPSIIGFGVTFALIGVLWVGAVIAVVTSLK